MYLPLPSASSLSFVSLGFHLLYTTGPHELCLVLSQSHTIRIHIVMHSPNSLPTVQDPFISVGSLRIGDVVFAEEARDVRFGAVASDRCQKHVVNMYDDHSDEISRRIAQAEESKIQSEGSQAVSLECVTQCFPPTTGRIGQTKNTFHQWWNGNTTPENRCRNILQSVTTITPHHKQFYEFN